MAVAPQLAGSYFTWEAEQARNVPPTIGATLAIAGTHDWGPTNTTVIAGDDTGTLCSSWQDFVAKFGASDTELSRAVFLGFKGQGFGGRGGAGAVLVVRQAAASAAKASKILQNTTPASALTLTAKYNGTRANALRVTVQAGTAASTKELLILDGALLVEKYVFPDTGAGVLATLAAQINLLSDWVTATVQADAGVTLANISSTPLTGGLDGATLTGTEWTATMALLDLERWSVFAPANLSDSTILTTVRAWQKARNLAGARCLLVDGAAITETGANVSTAVTRAQGTNNWDEVVLGAFVIHDHTFNRDMSSAEYASRVAGAIIARGEKNDAFYLRFADCALVSGPSVADEVTLLNGGVTSFSRDTNRDAPVFIREGVTSYSNDAASTLDATGAKTHPVWFYKRIKNVRIQHAIEIEAQEWATSGAVIGELPVSEKSRSLVLGHFKELYQSRQDNEVVQPGWSVTIDQAATAANGGDDSDGIYVQHGFHPTRSVRIIYHTARIG